MTFIPAATKRVFYGWWIIAACIVGIAANPGQAAFGSLGLFIVPLGEEFSWNRGEISLASTVFTVTLALSLPIIGKLVDRFGTRKVLMPSIVLFGSLLAAIPLLTSELWHFIGLFLLIGSLGAGANALAYLRTISAWFDRRRGLALGLAMAGGGLGYALVPPLVQYLIDEYGWRAGYFALAAVVLVIALPIVFLILRETPEEMGLQPDGDVVEADHDSAELAIGMTRSEALRTRTFWLLAFIFAALTFSLYGLLQHLVPMLTDRGMDTSAAALAASTIGISIVFARVLIGYLIDRIFAPRVALVCFLLSALSLALLASGAVGATAFLAAVLAGLSIGAELDLLAFLASRYFGLKSFGEIYGLLFASFLVGASIGPVAYGYGYETSGSYVTMLALCCILILCACVVCAVLPAYTRFGDE